MIDRKLRRRAKEMAAETNRDAKWPTLGSANLRQGVILSHDPATEKCSLYLSGDTTKQVDDVPLLPFAFAPSVDDTVWLLQNGSDLISLGGQGPAAGEYDTYLPDWISSGTAPSLGNGLRAGRFKRKGKGFDVIAEFIFGSTTTYGTGQYSITLPFNARTSPEQRVQVTCHNAATAIYEGTGWVAVAGAAALFVDAGGAGGALSQVSPTIPFTFGTGDKLTMMATLEAT